MEYNERLLFLVVASSVVVVVVVVVVASLVFVALHLQYCIMCLQTNDPDDNLILRTER